VQSWFRWGTVIAGGDVTPPIGTAWISRIFMAWTWSGSNLGGPSALGVQLPCAATLGFIQVLGGSAELAQRVWYSGLFVGAAVAAVWLLLVLHVRPLAAVLGAMAYAFSPYVVAQVVSNPVFLAALALLPVIPAAVIAGATRQVRLRTSVVLVIATAPMLGYVYQNPPLLGMVIGTALFVPLLCASVSGWSAARRAVLILALALPITVAASAYWVIPSILQLALVAQGQLAAISSWSWTEGRATVLNAFWLNAVWGWPYKE